MKVLYFILLVLSTYIFILGYVTRPLIGDALGYSHAEPINYSNIAGECAVDSKTVREYYQILVDTLLGTMIEPFKRKQGLLHF